LNRNHTANSHHLAKNHQRADDFEWEIIQTSFPYIYHLYFLSI
jgi:hypothetical protein